MEPRDVFPFANRPGDRQARGRWGDRLADASSGQYPGVSRSRRRVNV